MGAQNAKADLEEYRAGYPTQRDNPHEKDNLRFYKGKALLPASPLHLSLSLSGNRL
jgi:hypothetical protein